MKKQKITTLLLTMALCASAVLSGCAASAASQTEPNQSTTSSTPFEEAKDSGTPISSDEASSVQAYENDEVLSSEEQAKAEQERRAEIAEKYSIYEPYRKISDRGINAGESWKIRIDMTPRNGLVVPAQEFVLIITIKDPKGHDIYSEVVNGLRERGYITNNLETRQQVRQRQ